MAKVNIKGLDKAELLQALHARSKALGMGALHDRGNLTVDQCREIINHRTDEEIGLYFDYLNGRVLKVDLEGDELDTRLYDRDVGEGAGEQVVNNLRNRAADAVLK
jgi:hypothetical protein